MHRLLKYFLVLSICISSVIGAFSFFVVQQNHPDLKLTPLSATFKNRAWSGVVIQKNKSWRLLRWAPFNDGLPHGLEILWHPNGQRELERSFERGVLHGTMRGWYSNGQIRFQRQYNLGKDEGEFWAWHPNGVLAYFIKYLDGEEIAYKSWSAFGKPFYNYVYQDNRKVGTKGGKFCRRQNSGS